MMLESHNHCPSVCFGATWWTGSQLVCWCDARKHARAKHPKWLSIADYCWLLSIITDSCCLFFALLKFKSPNNLTCTISDRSLTGGPISPMTHPSSHSNHSTPSPQQTTLAATVTPPIVNNSSLNHHHQQQVAMQLGQQQNSTHNSSNNNNNRNTTTNNNNTNNNINIKLEQQQQQQQSSHIQTHLQRPPSSNSSHSGHVSPANGHLLMPLSSSSTPTSPGSSLGGGNLIVASGDMAAYQQVATNQHNHDHNSNHLVGQPLHKRTRLADVWPAWSDHHIVSY